MKKQSKKQIEARISKAFYFACSGIRIPMREIPTVFEVGKYLIAEGADDEALQAGLKQFAKRLEMFVEQFETVKA